VNTTDGTATIANSDYASVTSQTLTFIGTANETQTFTVSPTADTILESDEDLTVSMDNLSGTTLPVNITDNATVTITNDDNATVTIEDIFQDEDSGTITVTATLDAAVQGGFTVDVNTTDGTATIGNSDYTAVTSQTLTFIGTAGETQTFTVSPTADTILESDEDLTVSMDNLSATTLPVNITDGATVTIVNDDTATVTIADVTVSESVGTATFTVTLIGNVQDSFTVNYATSSNTAIGDVDYTTSNGIVTFPVGSLSGAIQTFAVDITDDIFVEPTETYTVTLSGITGLTTISDRQAEGKIIDNDAVTIDINNVSVSEGKNGTTNFEFIVSLSNSSSLITTVDYETVDGTAKVSNGDYIGTSPSTLTFLPGELTKTVTVIVNGDRVTELDEIFTVELSNLNANGNTITLGNAIGIGTIINDDHLPVIDDVIKTGIENYDVLFGVGDFIAEFNDVDGDALYSIEVLSLPENGVLYLNTVAVNIGDVILASEINTMVFTPSLNWHGVTSFDYNASDEFNTTLVIEQVIITVTAVNNVPVANDDFISTLQNTPIVDAITADNDELSGDGGNIWELVGVNGGATDGTVIMNIEGVYTYTPNIYFFGTDSFVYSITDENGDVSNAVVTITVLPESSPSLELIKTADVVGGGYVGDVITYTFTVTNTGNITINNISITDPLIYEISIAVGGSLTPNESVVVTANYTITQEDLDIGSVTNSATVSGVDTLGNEISDISDQGNPTDGDDNPTVTTLDQLPEIAIVKEAVFNDDNKDGFAQSGETITYTFKVANVGNVTLTNISIVDPLPGVIVSGSAITLESEEFDESTFTATYVITQDDINYGSVSNQASVFGTSPKGVVVEDMSDDFDVNGDNPTVLLISGCVIEVFNAVSPNGDGENDVFYIRGLECYSDNSVEIYNRWGVLVFKRDHYNNTDRAFKGISEGNVTVNGSRELPDGTYYYILQYKEGANNVQQKAGYLYINRR
jgi:gliding motility-associated-like protein/uncharacterized repeat protein (TIGR01451 family)